MNFVDVKFESLRHKTLKLLCLLSAITTKNSRKSVVHESVQVLKMDI